MLAEKLSEQRLQRSEGNKISKGSNRDIVVNVRKDTRNLYLILHLDQLTGLTVGNSEVRYSNSHRWQQHAVAIKSDGALM